MDLNNPRISLSAKQLSSNLTNICIFVTLFLAHTQTRMAACVYTQAIQRVSHSHIKILSAARVSTAL